MEREVLHRHVRPLITQSHTGKADQRAVDHAGCHLARLDSAGQRLDKSAEANAPKFPAHNWLNSLLSAADEEDDKP